MFNLFRLRPRRRKTAPSGFHPEWFAGGVSSVSGQVVTPDRAMREATVAACVRILAESVAQLPVKVFRADGETEDSGVLVELLRYPNAWQDSFQFREYMMVCLCLRGNFYALMVKNRAGEVVELLPLSPESVGVRLRDWEPVYSYTDALGRSAECGPDKMLHVRGESLDGVIGFSPIGYHRNTIGLSLATEAHGGRIFRNGARPGGILTHPAKLSDEALEHLRQSWAASHGGENAGGTAILEEGMDFKAVSMTNEDAQYLETRKFQRGLICGIFRVPPHMVADLEKATFSNIEHQSIEFAKYSILPWAVRIETAFRRALLTPKQRAAGLHIRLVLDGLERADIKTRYESYSIAVQNGILSPNECRALENRRPREGGDVFLQPLNMTDGTGAGADESGLKSWIALRPDRPLFDAAEFFRARERDREPAAKAADEDEDEDDEHEHDDWADGEWSEESAELNQIMRDFRPKLEKMYREIVAKEVAEIRKLVDKYFPETEEKRFTKSAQTEFMDALRILYEKLTPDMTANNKRVLYTDLIGPITAMAAKQCGVSKRKLLFDLEKTIGDYASIEAERHVKSAVGQLRDLVQREGDVHKIINERLVDWMGKWPDKQARHGAVCAANWYARESYRAAGVRKLRWVTNGSKTCGFCRRLHGKVAGIEGVFAGKGETFHSDGKADLVTRRKIKHPPIHRGCVCAIVPVFEYIVPEELRESVRKCAESADLFEKGQMEEAQEIGGKALRDLLNASGLLKEGYKIKKVNFTLPPESPNAYMGIAVAKGQLSLSTEEFSVSGSRTWLPAQGVMNALKKIHEGAPLTFMDEASLEALFHEIQHTRQNLAGEVKDIHKPLLEMVNEWTARRNYREFLKKFGRESIIPSDRIKREAFGYPRSVKNFDALLKHLKIDDNKALLDEMTRINETEPANLFAEHVSKLLSGMTKVESVQIKEALQNISDPNFNGYLK